MKWLIELLGGVSREAYDNSMKYERSCYDRIVVACEKDINTQRENHDAAMRQASAQLQQVQEMLRQAELRLARVEEERANASAGWTAEKETREFTEQQCAKLRDDNANLLFVSY